MMTSEHLSKSQENFTALQLSLAKSSFALASENMERGSPPLLGPDRRSQAGWDVSILQRRGKVQAYLIDIVGLVPDCCNKANIAIK